MEIEPSPPRFWFAAEACGHVVKEESVRFKMEWSGVSVRKLSSSNAPCVCTYVRRRWECGNNVLPTLCPC